MVKLDPKYAKMVALVVSIAGTVLAFYFPDYATVFATVASLVFGKEFLESTKALPGGDK